MQKELSNNSNSGDKKNRSVLFIVLFFAVIVIVAVIVNIFTDGLFLDPSNLSIIVSNSIFPTFIAWGLCFLFACGYTDLSIGAVVVLGSFATCVFGNWFGYPGVILGGLVTGTLLIFLNFTIFAFTKIPSWIASICMALVYEAAAVGLRVNKTTRVLVDTELNRSFRALGHMPWNLVLLIAGLIVVYIIYTRTNLGLRVRAIGGNKDVSRAMGVNILRTLLWVGLVSGVLIGFAAVIQQSFNGRTILMTGLLSIQLIFQPLAITLLAQIMERWINVIIAVPICSIIIYAVFNLMTFLGIPGITLQQVFLGAFLIAFGIGGQRGVKGVVK